VFLVPAHAVKIRRAAAAAKRSRLFKQFIDNVINSLFGDYNHGFATTAEETVPEGDASLG
jgi:hypothetical protein